MEVVVLNNKYADCASLLKEGTEEVVINRHGKFTVHTDRIYYFVGHLRYKAVSPDGECIMVKLPSTIGQLQSNEWRKVLSDQIRYMNKGHNHPDPTKNYKTHRDCVRLIAYIGFSELVSNESVPYEKRKRVTGIVYIITCTVEDNKSYVGQTTRTMNDRWREHARPRSGCTLICKAIQRRHHTEFVRRILWMGDVDRLDAVEAHFIHKYDTVTPRGYNCTAGRNLDSSFQVSDLTNAISRNDSNAEDVLKYVFNCLTRMQEDLDDVDD